MPGNPLISQGSLNRLRASVVWPANPTLNVTPSFLGKEMIGLALEGESATYIPTATGATTSPEPYMMIALSIHLLKTQNLAAQYKAQMEFLATIGDGTVRPDASSLPPYAIVNCSISSVRELKFNGTDAGFMVSVKGYYLINSSLWG